MGHLLVRHGNDLVSVLMPPWTGAQHEVDFLGTFQLYRNGQMGLTQPIGYGGASIRGDGANSGLVAGLSSMARQGCRPIRAR